MKKLLAILVLLSVVLINGCKKDDQVIKVGLCPLVVSTIPLDKAVNVPLNQVVSATFNEAMNPATITGSSFTITGTTTVGTVKAATVVTGTVTYSGMTATFTPSSPLTTHTTYTGTITTAARDLAGNALQADHVWSFSTDVSPTVTGNPANNAVDVLLNKIIVATFSAPMDTLTLKAPGTITVKQGTTVVAGKYSYTTTTASFTPTVALSPFNVYTVTITTAAKNALGTPLAADFIWNFTTIPQLTTSSLPVLGGTTTGGGTFAQGSSVTVTAVPNAGYAFTNWKDGVNIVSTVAAYQFNMAGNKNLVAFFTAIAAGTFTLNVAAVNGTVVKNPNLVNYSGGSAVTLTPTANTGYVFTSWSGDATGTASPLTVTMNANKNITANFTAIASAFTLNVTAVNGTVVKNPDQLNYLNGANVVLSASPNSGYVFSSWSGDASGTVSPVTITMNANKNVTANFILAPVVSPVVDLKTAGRFGILAGVGISNNAGFSEVRNQDVGIYPGLRSSVTGFPPAKVVGGAIYASDDIAPPGTPAMLAQAKLDLVAAYLFAEGASSPAPATVSGDQGGKTLAPGIYKSTSTLLIQNGDLTLDGKGDPNATWIFQIASAFTTVGGAGGSIILTGGAQAKNIFWQTGSSAVIGDYTTFYGNVLALQSITMNSYSTAVGRMLAQNGAVVMTGTNIITKP
jgi:uncharacterized repeat protein (TIGR02543 family)